MVTTIAAEEHNTSAQPPSGRPSTMRTSRRRRTVAHSIQGDHLASHVPTSRGPAQRMSRKRAACSAAHQDRPSPEGPLRQHSTVTGQLIGPPAESMPSKATAPTKRLTAPTHIELICAPALSATGVSYLNTERRLLERLTWRECRHDHLDSAPLNQLGQGNDAQRPGSSNPAPHRPRHPDRQCD
jgi:hypothetical protein